MKDKPSKRSVMRAISNYGIAAEKTYRGHWGSEERHIKAGIHLGKLCGVTISKEEMQRIIYYQNWGAC
jgi:hypothetical protein